jgi:hypothetical protein
MSSFNDIHQGSVRTVTEGIKECESIARSLILYEGRWNNHAYLRVVYFSLLLVPAVGGTMYCLGGEFAASRWAFLAMVVALSIIGGLYWIAKEKETEYDWVRRQIIYNSRLCKASYKYQRKMHTDPEAIKVLIELEHDMASIRSCCHRCIGHNEKREKKGKEFECIVKVEYPLSSSEETFLTVDKKGNIREWNNERFKR